jgi:hypothetical protein
MAQGDDGTKRAKEVYARLYVEKSSIDSCNRPQMLELGDLF